MASSLTRVRTRSNNWNYCKNSVSHQREIRYIFQYNFLSFYVSIKLSWNTKAANISLSWLNFYQLRASCIAFVCVVCFNFSIHLIGVWFSFYWFSFIVFVDLSEFSKQETFAYSSSHARMSKRENCCNFKIKSNHLQGTKTCSTSLSLVTLMF